MVAPSRKDRGGVRRRRVRADREPGRLGLWLLVTQRSGAQDETFSAHTRETMIDRPSRRPATGSRAHDVTEVHVVCRCGEHEVLVRADVAATGYAPRCSPVCDRVAANRRSKRPTERSEARDLLGLAAFTAVVVLAFWHIVTF